MARKQQSIKHMIWRVHFFLVFHYFALFMRFHRMLTTQFTAQEPILINCFVQNKHKKFSYTFITQILLKIFYFFPFFVFTLNTKERKKKRIPYIYYIYSKFCKILLLHKKFIFMRIYLAKREQENLLNILYEHLFIYLCRQNKNLFFNKKYKLHKKVFLQ